MAARSSFVPPPPTGSVGCRSTFFKVFPTVMLASRSPRTEAPPELVGGSGGGGGACAVDGGSGGGIGGWPDCWGGSWTKDVQKKNLSMLEK